MQKKKKNILMYFFLHMVKYVPPYPPQSMGIGYRVKSPHVNMQRLETAAISVRLKYENEDCITKITSFFLWCSKESSCKARLPLSFNTNLHLRKTDYV